jgi:hypothetical protein
MDFTAGEQDSHLVNVESVETLLVPAPALPD